LIPSGPSNSQTRRTLATTSHRSGTAEATFRQATRISYYFKLCSGTDISIQERGKKLIVVREDIRRLSPCHIEILQRKKRSPENIEFSVRFVFKFRGSQTLDRISVLRSSVQDASPYLEFGTTVKSDRIQQGTFREQCLTKCRGRHPSYSAVVTGSSQGHIIQRAFTSNSIVPQITTFAKTAFPFGREDHAYIGKGFSKLEKQFSGAAERVEFHAVSAFPRSQPLG